MKFCSHCGEGNLPYIIPEGDTRLRYVCNVCKTVHYQNPKIICGTLPIYEGKILMCRRAIQPRLGLWTLPAGFMENGETTPEAAQRETWEEACARIDMEGLYCIYNLPHISQVYLFFKGTVKNGEYGVGVESLETKLFAIEDLPWNEMAFMTVKRTIQLFIEDSKTSFFPIRMLDILEDHAKGSIGKTVVEKG
ncbi:MAG: NUDIX hydrolase [Pseudomonadota bacterium]